MKTINKPNHTCTVEELIQKILHHTEDSLKIEYALSHHTNTQTRIYETLSNSLSKHKDKLVDAKTYYKIRVMERHNAVQSSKHQKKNDKVDN